MRRRLVLLAPLLFAGGCGPAGRPPTGTDDLVAVRTTSVPEGTAGVAYEAVLEATGPHPPLQWRVVGGRLPTGLTLEADTGRISGWPRSSGRHRFTVEVRDGPDPALERDTTFAAATASFDLPVARGAVALLPFSPPPVPFGQSFAHVFEAAGGTPPYRFEVAGGRLPAGLTLASDGSLRGVAREAAGPYQPRVRATDATGGTAEASFDLRVVVPPLRIVTSALPDAAVGFAYAVEVRVSPQGGGPPYRWSVRPSPSALPPGIAFDDDTGRLVGVARSPGEHAFRLEVADAAGQTAGQDLTLRVNLGPVLERVTPASPPKDGGPVTLLGQAFQPGLRVTFGAAPPVPAGFVDATRATVVPPLSPPQPGAVDVVVTNPDGGTALRRGAFRYPLAVVDFAYAGVHGTALSSSRAIAAGDLDGDGLCDIAHVGSDGIEVLRPVDPAAGTWTVDAVRTSGSYDDVRLADVDADGDLDLVALRSSSTSTIEVYRNDGHGGFPSTASAVTSYPKPSGGHYPNTLAVGDVDGDGVPDLAFTSARGGQSVVWVYRGLGDGSFARLHEAFGTVWDAEGGCFAPTAVALADLDGDGRDDLVVTDGFPAACTAGEACPDTDGPDAHPGNRRIVAWVALAQAGGVPGPWSSVRLAGETFLDGDNEGAVVYDHDGDGALDLAVLGGWHDAKGTGVAFLTGDGRGGFGTRSVRSTLYDRRYGAAIDANLDDGLDLIVVGGDGRAGSAGALGYSVAECYLGGAEPTPVLAWTSGPEASGSISGANPGRVAVGDFDGDGRQDFAVDQSFNAKERFPNDQGDGIVEGVAVFLNRSR